jgi:hypothetical protein
LGLGGVLKIEFDGSDRIETEMNVTDLSRGKSTEVRILKHDKNGDFKKLEYHGNLHAGKAAK